MSVSLGFLLLSANGIFTLFCGLTILYYIRSKRIEKHLFYYSWASGFILYGSEITLRAFSFPFALCATLMFLALIFFVTGAWSLTRKKRLVYIFIANLILLSIIAAIYLLGMAPYDTAFVVANSFWPALILISVLCNRVLFGKSVDKFVVGWALLFLSNALLLNSEWVDLFAIFGKAVILWGIVDYDFVILTERVRRGLSSQLPPINTGAGKEGGLKLVINPSSSIALGENWVYRKVQQNVERGVRTCIFSFQDVIPHSMLRRMKWIKPAEIFIFLFSSSSGKAKGEFTVLPMGLTQIGAALSEVINKYSNSEKGFGLILLDLSLLVHTFGVYPIYNMLLSKMGSLREGGVDLFAFFHTETHSNKSIVSLFTSIADEVIKL